MKKGKGKGRSSSSGIGGAIASGVKEIGGAVLDAGKEAVKEAVAAGARSAVMSYRGLNNYLYCFGGFLIINVVYWAGKTLFYLSRPL